MLIDHDYEARRDGTRLVVLLHGWTGCAAKMDSLRRMVEATMPDADIYVPDLPIRRIFGTIPAADITSALVEAIDRRCAREGGRYSSIVLLGHSSGGVLARKVFLAAWGAADDVRGGHEVRPWAPLLDRIVFLAAVNRGWTIGSAATYVDMLVWRLGLLVSYIFYGGRNTILQTARGAPFLVGGRLQWLDLMREETKAAARKVVVVQLLGTIDDLVSPGDCIDHVADSNADGRRFLLLELPGTGHFDAIDVEPSRPAGALRHAIIADALARSPDELEMHRHAVRREYLEDELPPPPNPKVTHVVFVIHGIRDRGFWTKKIAQKIREYAARPDQVRCITASYGYFPMLPFLFKWGRYEKVEWLMDLYCEVRAHYPNAKFSYVGHSNGTYLLARALEAYPQTRFKSVVFAGSVVRRNFPWVDYTSTRRVRRVLNYVASMDWVVALLPKGLEPLRWFDLGGAGHVGFATPLPALRQFNYIKGKHSAGVRESQWDDIANFVLKGTPPAAKGDDWSAKQALWLRIASVGSTGIVGLLLLLVLAAGIGPPIAMACWSMASGVALGVAITAWLAAWLLAVWLIATRV